MPSIGVKKSRNRKLMESVILYGALLWKKLMKRRNTDYSLKEFRGQSHDLKKMLATGSKK